MAANTNNNLTRPIMEQQPTESCPICIEETDQPGNDFVALPCNGAHKAHPDCFRQWLDSPNAGHDKCPLCRQDLRHSCGHLLSVDLLVAGTAIPKGILESPCTEDCPGPEDPEQGDQDIEPNPEFFEWARHINHFWEHFSRAVPEAAGAPGNFSHGWVGGLVEFHEILALAEELVHRLQAHQFNLRRWHRDDISTYNIRLWNLQRELNNINTAADRYAAEHERYTQERFVGMQPEVSRAMRTVWGAVLGAPRGEEDDNASTTAQNGDAEDEDEPQVNDRDEHAAAVHDNSPDDAHLNNAADDAPAPPEQIDHNWNGPGFWEAQPANDNGGDNVEPAENWSNAIGVAGAEPQDDNPEDDDVEGEDDQSAVRQPLQEPEQHDQSDEDTIPQPPVVPAAPEPHYRPLRSAGGLAAIAAGALALQQAITAGTTPPAQPDAPLDAAPAALPEIEPTELEVEPEAAEDKDQQDQPQPQRPENDERAAQWRTEFMSAEWERLQRRRWGPKL
ncbi:uncharacterized protein PG986_008744 [Apiospora aurea]|uniref:RING-type domain-containing protein n=1 Tax=Apiospora aurea TaxID=335848 RepID=A0ABR1Q5T3_9PEZI